MYDLTINTFVTTATTSQLVEVYNKHAEKSVKRFADRKTAERRVAKVLAEVAQSTPTPASNSAGVAASWNDAETRAKRRQRSAVQVDGVEYRSVRKAYLALGLPLNDHIQVRMLLKREGSMTIDGREWKIVPLNY